MLSRSCCQRLVRASEWMRYVLARALLMRCAVSLSRRTRDEGVLNIVLGENFTMGVSSEERTIPYNHAQLLRDCRNLSRPSLLRPVLGSP